MYIDKIEFGLRAIICVHRLIYTIVQSAYCIVYRINNTTVNIPMQISSQIDSYSFRSINQLINRLTRLIYTEIFNDVKYLTNYYYDYYSI